MNIESITQELERLTSPKEAKARKTFVAKYKGKVLKLGSGKSAWNEARHAKTAVLCHFARLESDYKYYPNGRWDAEGKRLPFVSEGSKEREKEFRDKLWELIEIVELKQ